MPLEVVHKELIDFIGDIIVTIRQLTVNIAIMWITGEFCGILFVSFIGNL